MKRYTVALGPIEATARLKRDARREVETRAASALHRLEEGPILFTVDLTGTEVAAVVVIPTLDGWGYGWSDGHPRGRRITFGYTTRDAALWAAVSHVAQLCVTKDTDAAALRNIEDWAADALQDAVQAAALHGELSDRVAWLRRFDEALINGATTNEAHQIAGGMA